MRNAKIFCSYTKVEQMSLVLYNLLPKFIPREINMEKLIHISKNVFKPNKKCLALIALNVFPI
jgi:hypothetical protein